MAKQAAKVHDLTLKHNNIHFVRWRDVQITVKDYKLAGRAGRRGCVRQTGRPARAATARNSEAQLRHYELTPE